MGTVVSDEGDLGTRVPVANEVAGRVDLLDDGAEHEVRRDGREGGRRRPGADTAAPPAAAVGGTVVSIDVSRKLPLGIWTSSWWLVTSPTVWMRSISVPSSSKFS